MPAQAFFALMLLTGLCAGMAAAVVLVMALSPMWPLALVILAALPFGYWTSHRPWQGKRKSGQLKAFYTQLAGPPVTREGYATAVGALVGAGITLPYIGRIVWGN
jgi:hypothetical protein